MANRLAGFAVPPVRVVTPQRKFEIELAKFSPFLFDELDRALRENAKEIARQASGSIRRQKRVVRRRGRAAQAFGGDIETAGEPPQSRTGELARSIKVRKARGRKSLRYRIFSTTGQKSVALEYGAPRRGAPEHPFLRPARERLAPRNFRNVEDAVGKAIGEWARLGEVK